MKSGYLVSETPELRKLWNSTLGCVTHRKMNTDPSDISCVDSIPAQMNRQTAGTEVMNLYQSVSSSELFFKKSFVL